VLTGGIPVLADNMEALIGDLEGITSDRAVLTDDMEGITGEKKGTDGMEGPATFSLTILTRWLL
jgi:hypothetical protein